MPNNKLLEDRREALLAMLRDRGMEVHTYSEIDQMIEAELSKDDTQIDVDLVDELIQLKWELEAAQSAKKQAPRGGHRRKGAARWVVVAACVLAVTFGAMGIASAFNWADLVHFIAPLAKTIGINLNVDDERGEDTYVKQYSIPGEDSMQSQVFEKEAEMPDLLEGYPTKPQWLPEGYAFDYGSAYDSDTEKNVILTYTDGKYELCVQTSIYTRAEHIDEEIATLDIDGEIIEGPVFVELESGVKVAEDHGIITAMLVDDVASYMVWGALQQDDIISVLTSIKGE